MNMEWIEQTEAFLKQTLSSGTYLQKNPAQLRYRLEHSYRVANIAKTIAEKEGFDVTLATMAGLLHDVGYGTDWASEDLWKEHGRIGAAMARPFLVDLGLSEQQVGDICYGIAIHVDDVADFPWERTAFCETVGDADNIDRFDAYRIYETLEYQHFSELTLEEKREKVTAMLEKLHRLKTIPFATPTATAMWVQRLEDYIAFYQKLERQLATSHAILP